MTEEQIELLSERLASRTEQANEYILKQIGKSIAEIKQLTPAKAYQMLQILKYGGNYKEMVRKLKQLTGLNIKDINAIFEEYAKIDQEFYKQFYEYRKIPFVPYKDNKIIKEQTELFAELFKKKIYTMMQEKIVGYSIKDADGIVRFTGLKETYNRVLEQALTSLTQGKQGFDSAMQGIMQEIGQSGLKTLDYESGRSMRLDSAVRMHLNDALRNLHNANQEVYGNEFDFDGWEISVHANPAPDHEEVQGHQFKIEEYDLLQTKGIAKDVNNKEIDIRRRLKNGRLAEGQNFRPISTMNCYHVAMSIVVGVSKPRYTQEQLDKIKKENKKGFRFEGKKYTMYEGTQLQREIERNIREQMDVQIIAKEGNNEELVLKAQNKIDKLITKYNKLNKTSGLLPKLERIKVAGYKPVK